MTSEETKIRRSTSFVRKRRKIRKIKLASAAAFYLLFLIGSISLFIGEDISSWFLGLSTIPLIATSLTTYLDFKHSIQKLDILSFHIFEAKRKTTLFRVREDEKKKEEAISHLVDAIIDLRKILTESRERYLLKAAFIHEHLEKALEVLENYVMNSLESEQSLRKTEEVLGNLLQKIVTGNLRKVEETKEEAAKNLEKKEVVLPLKYQAKEFFLKKETSFYTVFLLSLIALTPFFFHLVGGMTSLIISSFSSLLIASVILKSEFR